MTASINGTTGVTFPDASVQGTAATGFGFKNRIINGDMRIDQRNAGASVTGNEGVFAVDRWKMRASQSGKVALDQNANNLTPPQGFSTYLGVTSNSSYSITSGDYFFLSQLIEGFNTADFNWGTSNAATITLSFWVRSSLTGTFGAGVREGNAGTAQYPFNYTINAANTWEQKTVTIPGPTIGTWQTGNLGSIEVVFGLGIGSTYTGGGSAWTASSYFVPNSATSVVGTSGATFYITGVQLEKGSTATSFDYRPYGTEEILCRRYYQRIYGGSPYGGIFASGSTLNMPVTFGIPLRATPTVSISNVTHWSIHNATANIAFTGIGINNGATAHSIQLDLSGLSGGTIAAYGHLRNYDLVASGWNTNAWIAFNSEL